MNRAEMVEVIADRLEGEAKFSGQCVHGQRLCDPCPLCASKRIPVESACVCGKADCSMKETHKQQVETYEKCDNRRRPKESCPDCGGTGIVNQGSPTKEYLCDCKEAEGIEELELFQKNQPLQMFRKINELVRAVSIDGEKIKELENKIRLIMTGGDGK